MDGLMYLLEAKRWNFVNTSKWYYATTIIHILLAPVWWQTRHWVLFWHLEKLFLKSIMKVGEIYVPLSYGGIKAGKKSDFFRERVTEKMITQCLGFSLYVTLVQWLYRVNHVTQVCLHHIPDGFPCDVGFPPASSLWSSPNEWNIF